jgi:hypothetical protein
MTAGDLVAWKAIVGSLVVRKLHAQRRDDLRR